MSWRSGVAAGVVVGVCGVVAAAGTVMAAESQVVVADADGPAGPREFLRNTQSACAPVESAPGEDAYLTAATIPGMPGQDVPGRLSVGSLAGGEPTTAAQPGSTVEVTRFPRPTAGGVSATGGMAPGAVGSRLIDDSRAESKGLASSACGQAVPDAWLVGGGAGEGQRDLLTLMNPTQTDSMVDVAAYAPGGELKLTSNEGLSVPAGKFRQVRLDALSPATENMVVHVRTRVGLIVPVVVDDMMDGLTPLGTDIITDAGTPARSVITGAAPAGPGDRSLVLLAPGSDATVQISAMTDQGEIPLLGGQPNAFKADHVRVIDLSTELAGRAAAIHIVSDVPVVANLSAATDPSSQAEADRAARVTEAEAAVKAAKGAADRKAAEAELAKAETAKAIAPGQDLAWLGTTTPVRGESAVTGLRSQYRTTVYLTADGNDVTASVATLKAGTGQELGATQTIPIPAGTTKAVSVKPPKGSDGYSVLVARTQGPGALRVSHLQTGSAGAITGYATGALPIWVNLPDVQVNYAE
jgi:Family of unknown function (DUF5719)